MRLLLDASAAINLSKDPPPNLVPRLVARKADWRLDVPVTVFFELSRQADAYAMAEGLGAPAGLPASLAWVEEAWNRGLPGGLLDFRMADARALRDHLQNAPPEAYLRQKATKVWTDRNKLRNKAVDEVWKDPRLVGALPVKEAKQRLHQAGTALVAGDLKKIGHISAALDWIQLGLALNHTSRILTDDQGDEFPVTHRFTTTQLIQALS